MVTQIALNWQKTANKIVSIQFFYHLGIVLLVLCCILVFFLVMLFI